MTRLHATAYLLGSKVHWPERERAIARALDALAALMREGPRRVVDVGCGPGLLADTVLSRKLAYLGVEPDPEFIDDARRRWTTESASFRRATVRTMALRFAPSDVVVVNGVAHHLQDEDMDLLLRESAAAGAMIICDHRREPGRTGALARALQAADRGRYVRDLTYFERLPGFDLRGSERFGIGLLGMPLWPYFCATYTPSGERP